MSDGQRSGDDAGPRCEIRLLGRMLGETVVLSGWVEKLAR